MAKLDDGMGFKDFKAFNPSMLASQWWRIMHNTVSLAYMVLKEKYFPYQDPIKVQHRASSSYLWRSLMAGCVIIKKGNHWRVGNGSSIDVWRHRWVRGLPNCKVPLLADQEPQDLPILALWKKVSGDGIMI